MDISRLPEHMRTPEAQNLLRAYPGLIASRFRQTEDYRRRGFRRITLTATAINFYIFVMALNGNRGIRAQELIDGLEISRRTIRDSLKRLEADGLIMREAGGAYHPTEQTAEVIVAEFAQLLSDLRRISDAVATYDRRFRR